MYELFSRRNRDRSLDPDVFEYDFFPEAFRNQYYMLFCDAVSKIEKRFIDIWEQIDHGYSREKGLKSLGKASSQYSYMTYVDNCTSEDLLDLIDYSFSRVISNGGIRCYFYLEEKNFFEDAITELNYRFRQHNLGYEFCNGQLIRIDNQMTHQEIVKPALHLLTDPKFQGANEEYLLSWSHYKAGKYKDAILNAGKAFESTMKIICEELGFPYDKNRDDAKKLLAILKDNGFYPTYLDSYMNGIRSTLESGAPVIRNKTAGHGQGINSGEAPQCFALYELNMVATNIVFFYGLYQSSQKGVRP